MAMAETFEQFVDRRRIEVVARGDPAQRRSTPCRGACPRSPRTHLAAHRRIVKNDGNYEAYVRKAMVNLCTSWRRRRWNAEMPFATPDHAENGTAPAADDAGLDLTDVIAGHAVL